MYPYNEHCHYSLERRNRWGKFATSLITSHVVSSNRAPLTHSLSLSLSPLFDGRVTFIFSFQKGAENFFRKTRRCQPIANLKLNLTSLLRPSTPSLPSYPLAFFSLSAPLLPSGDRISVSRGGVQRLAKAALCPRDFSKAGRGANLPSPPSPCHLLCENNLSPEAEKRSMRDNVDRLEIFHRNRPIGCTFSTLENSILKKNDEKLLSRASWYPGFRLIFVWMEFSRKCFLFCGGLDILTRDVSY